MTKTNNILLTLVACFLMSACYQDIDMEKYRPEPTLVLNCIISPDTVIMASVSHTVFFTDHHGAPPMITDANVRLKINGQFIQTMIFNEASGLYISNFRPQAGDSITIEASSALGYVSGKEVVPKLIPIENITLSCRTFDDPDQMYWGPNGVTYGKSYEVTYHITFTDNALERNFYCIRIETEDGLAAETIDYSHDNVFLDQQSIIDGVTTDTGIYGNEGRTFSDRLFNGKTYIMKIVEKSPLYTTKPISRPRKIILYTLSEAYYQYLTSILNSNEEAVSNNLIDLGFSEPSPHYSNITGGTGIVGAVQSSISNIDLINIIK